MLESQRGNSQEMQLGAQSWGPVEFSDCSLLDHAEPISYVKPDLVQTSADKFGISVVEVTSLRDIVAERKELDCNSVVLS